MSISFSGITYKNTFYPFDEIKSVEITPNDSDNYTVDISVVSMYYPALTHDASILMESCDLMYFLKTWVRHNENKHFGRSVE